MRNHLPPQRMPTKPKKKKTAKKALMKKKMKKTMKAIGRKKLVKKVAKKVTKKVVRAAVKKITTAVAVGTVVHYYDLIGVAVDELKSPLRLGERILFRRGAKEFIQKVSSMQIEHQPIQVAAKGQGIGMKVDQPVERGTKVLRA